MSAGVTSMGGPQGNRFPETTWGLVSRLKDGDVEELRTGFEALARRYWRPVYHFIRHAWAKSNDDAKDLTQAFFLWLVEENALRAYLPDRSGFRTFLKLLLGRFVGNQERALSRLKRGGHLRLLSLDDGNSPVGDDLAADPGSANPEEIFDRAWIVEVVDHAIARIRERSGSGEAATAFRIYEAYDLAAADGRPTHAELAATHRTTAKAVEVMLYSMREQVRQEIRAELSRLVSDEQGLQEEWNALFGTGGPGRPGA